MSLIYQKFPTANVQVRPSSFIHTTEKDGVDKIVNLYLKGTDEVKNILRTECEVIIECSFCRSLFRSITTFINHNQTICHRLCKNAQEIVNLVKSSQNSSIVQRQRPQELVNGVKSAKNASFVHRPQELVNGVKLSKNAFIVQRPQELLNGVKSLKNASIVQRHDDVNGINLSQTGPISQRSRGRPRSMPYPNPKPAATQQSSTVSSKSLMVPLKTSTPKVVKEKMPKKSDEKTNKTLGSALHIIPPNTCRVCNQSINSTGAKIKHIWGHIKEKMTSKDPKDVHSYYCDVSSCNFLTNFIEEAKFHKMEGHTVVDNHETTDELFSAAIKQCFDDLNESLEEKIYKMRHYRG